MKSTSKSLLVSIGGPTASGKSDLTLKLANAYHTAIVSADSRQVYREMNIGTAKPDKKSLHAVPHFLIDHLSINQDYSAGRFEKEALELLETLFKDRQIVFITGGTGFYLKAVLSGIPEIPPIPEYIKRKLDRMYKSEGLEAIVTEVRRRDPVFAAMADPNNPVRWIRALQVIEATGKPFSDFKSRGIKERPFNSLRLCIDLPRYVLHDRIHRRVEEMFARGLVDEVRRLKIYRHKPALQTVGYREVFDYLDGHYNLKECKEKVKVNTRRYAKRQITWFKNQGNWTWLKPDFDVFRNHIDNHLSRSAG
jgi:tRNA dimethylallyltransferase